MGFTNFIILRAYFLYLFSIQSIKSYGRKMDDRSIGKKKYLNNIIYTWDYMFLNWQNLKNDFELKFICDHFLALLCEYISRAGFSHISFRYQKQGIGS